MNEMAYVFHARLPLLVWQQVDAPEYRRGFTTVACIFLAMIITTFAIRRLDHLESERRHVVPIKEHYQILLFITIRILTPWFRVRNHQHEAEDSLSDSVSVRHIGTQWPQKL